MFGFNGKEKINEQYGEGNLYDYGFRIYDPRIARFLSFDPLAKNFPWNSPYSFAENSPLAYIDQDGLEKFSVHLYNDDNGRTLAIVVLEDINVVGLSVDIYDINGTLVENRKDFKYQFVDARLLNVSAKNGRLYAPANEYYGGRDNAPSGMKDQVIPITGVAPNNPNLGPGQDATPQFELVEDVTKSPYKETTTTTDKKFAGVLESARVDLNTLTPSQTSGGLLTAAASVKVGAKDISVIEIYAADTKDYNTAVNLLNAGPLSGVPVVRTSTPEPVSDPSSIWTIAAYKVTTSTTETIVNPK